MAGKVLDKNNYYKFNVNKINEIPGNPIVYTLSQKFINNFNKGISIDKISDFTGSQNITANNNKYLRYHWEISKKDIDKELKIRLF